MPDRLSAFVREEIPGYSLRGVVSMISEFSLFVFTTFAGTAVGAYVANAAFPLSRERRMPWLFPLVCLVLLGVGLVGCLTHLARPELFLNALSNARAGIAQEAYCAIAFGIVLVADLAITCVKGDAPRALRIVGAVVAVVLACVMGLAYTPTLGTPAWCTWSTVPLFVVGDAAVGFALYGLFANDAYKKPAFFATTVAIGALFALTLVFEALHFSACGLDVMAFVVAIVVAPVASCVCAALARTKDGAALPVVIFAVALVGVCIARWAFYAASVI